MIETALYLIPVQLSDGELNCVLPQANIALVSHIKHFIVENVRSARRFLKKCDREIDIDSLTFYELNRHTDPRQVSTYLDALQKGEPMGVISEAGCPAIARCRCGGYRTAQRTEGASAGGPVEHIDGADGQRIQWTEFCVHWLSAYRGWSKSTQTERNGAAHREGESNSDFHRNSLSQQFAAGGNGEIATR